MTTPSLNGFFGGGGGKYLKFPAIGTSHTGVITCVHPPENQQDFDTRQPIEGKFQVRIELATDEREVSDPYDDGSRVLVTKGWLQGSIGDALRKAGAREPEIGGTLTVKYVRDGQPSRPGLNGPKQYEVVYVPSAKTAGFFGTDTPAVPAVSVNDAPPPGVDAGAWNAMPPEARAAVKASLAGSSGAPF